MKPDKVFTDEDKFKIDQFIIKGGKALFFIDPVKIDSLGLEGNFAKPFSVNLEDMFFKYGARLNTNLLKDMQLSAAIPMNVVAIGESPNIQLIPWPYFPLINTKEDHPIIRNLDAIHLKYTSTIDTINTPKIKKTALLSTSEYTQILQTPATLSYNSAAKDFDPNKQTQGKKVVSYLLEGTFDSFYTNSILPSDPRFAQFKAVDKPSKIIICADGDLPTNDYDQTTMQPLPLGFDKYSKHTFANADFVKNAVDYLLDPNGIIAARTKYIALRPLDKAEITDHRLKWQIINLAIPLLFLVLLFAIFTFYSKKKFQ